MLAEDLGFSPYGALKSVVSDVVAPVAKAAATSVPGGAAALKAWDIAYKAYKAGKGPNPGPKPTAPPAKKPFPIGLVIVPAALLGYLVLRKR